MPTLGEFAYLYLLISPLYNAPPIRALGGGNDLRELPSGSQASVLVRKQPEVPPAGPEVTVSERGAPRSNFERHEVLLADSHAGPVPSGGEHQLLPLVPRAHAAGDRDGGSGRGGAGEVHVQVGHGEP